jgi:hypothetical protein
VSVFAGPPKEPKPPVVDKCCGDPKNLDGNAHPWVYVGEDVAGRIGSVFACPVCEAIDAD